MFNVITSSAVVVSPQLTQSVHDFLYSLLALLLNGLTAAAIWAIRTWLKSLNSSWKQALAKRLVAYAQQKIGDNAERRQYVASELAKRFPRLDAEEIDHLLEEAVVQLKSQEVCK